ncbi:MAG: hypothetical protein MZV70_06310 [Desulfobacterales bacterium]|nr:hypothetical protein [Desulfobacterales bacterium]
MVLITVLERRGRSIGAAGRAGAVRPTGTTPESPEAAAGREVENQCPPAKSGWPGAVPSAGSCPG